MAEIVIRKAREEEALPLFDLQNRIFHEEQGIPLGTAAKFMALEPQFWCAAREGELLGVLAAWQEGSKVHCGRLAVSPQCRGQHVGSRLLERCFTDLFDQGAEELYMEARPVTVGIVTKMGGEVQGPAVMFFSDTVTPMTLRREAFRLLGK